MTTETNKRLEAAAEQWAGLQDVEPSQEEVTRWLAWLEEEGGNVESFEQINDLAQRLHHTRESAPERLGQLRASRLFADVAPRVRTPGRQSHRKSVLVFSLAAAVIAATGIALFLEQTTTVERVMYSTAVADQREVVLPDGSRVTLGGASSIETAFSGARREVLLRAGEAYFSVQPDPSRPFVVNADIATVRALGTAFNVRRNSGRIAVTVVEGRVEVARAGGRLERLAAAAGLRKPQTARLAGAEQLIVEAQSKSLTVVRSDPQRATSWRQGRLEFADEPLNVVIGNVSRYSKIAIVLDDPALSAITYTGTFVPGQLDSWLEALEEVFHLEVRRTDGALTLTRISESNPLRVLGVD